ncbi:MAG: MarR family winged helix-turn-helix transcriptional regulator [Aestuariivita sp.]|uniref:MarR family winged helix-turn-helix transcriptional regulator n=1 Tax=Aestuariivita sp. TaxID=1872407 RepID=UPI003BB14239
MREKDDLDLRLFLPYLLNQAAEESSLMFQQVYKSRYGMLRTEWRVLFHLGIYGELTAKEIGERARMHKTKISRAVQKLSDRRFLVRSRDEADRRSEKLSLTAMGRTAYEDLRKVAEDYDAALTKQFAAEDVKRLREILLALSGA